MLLYISLSERGPSRVTDLRQCVIFSVLEVGKEDEIQILSKMANPTQRQAIAIYLVKQACGNDMYTGISVLQGCIHRGDRCDRGRT